MVVPFVVPSTITPGSLGSFVASDAVVVVAGVARIASRVPAGVAASVTPSYARTRNHTAPAKRTPSAMKKTERKENFLS
jgi:hypothetical protein